MVILAHGGINVKVPEYTITISNQKLTSIKVRDCYNYLIHELKHSKINVDASLGTMIALVGYIHGELPMDSRRTAVVDTFIVDFKSISEETYTNYDDESLKRVIFDILMQLPEVAPDIGLAQMLIELNEFWSRNVYSFEQRDV